MARARKLPSGNWRVLIFVGKDEQGKRIYKSFTDPDRAMAEFYASEYRAKHKDVPICDLTLEQAIERYIDSKANVLSPTTLQAYRSIAAHRFKTLQKLLLTDLTSEVVQTAINREAVGHSPKTIANAYGLVTAAVNLFRPDTHFRVTLPAKRRTIKELPQPADVIAAVRGKPVELPTLLSLWLSLRQSEVCGLQYGDIKDGVLTVRRTVLKTKQGNVVRDQTKTYNSTRSIRLPPVLIDLIGTGAPDERIVKTSAAVIYNQFVKAISDAGLPHMRFHDLRHLNASVMLRLGVPDKYAMERGGWSTNAVLQTVYQHTFTDKRAAVDDKIDQYFEAIFSPDATQRAAQNPAERTTPGI